MKSEDRRALRIARDALDLDGTQRNVFVARECSDEIGLKQRVDAFLRSIDRIESECDAPDPPHE